MSLKFIEVKISQKIMQRYLEDKFKSKIKIIEYKKLGTGWHGTGYSIKFKLNGERKKVVLRTLRPEGFSHDYFSDRAASFIMQHELAKNVKNHIKSIDVGGYTPKGKLVSMGDCKEFFQIVEFVDGKEYLHDLIAIMTLKGELIAIAKARMHSNEIIKKESGLAATLEAVFMAPRTYPKIQSKK